MHYEKEFTIDFSEPYVWLIALIVLGPWLIGMKAILSSFSISAELTLGIALVAGLRP